MLEKIDYERLRELLPLKFSIDFLKRNKICPISTEDGILKVAISSFEGLKAAKSLGVELNLEIEPVLADEREILNAISWLYDAATRSTLEEVESLEEEKISLEELSEREDIITSEDSAPIIKLVNSIIYQAIRERASDIHFEPYERELRIRYRIDGILYDRLNLPKKLHPPVISRIKVMSRLDIAEHFIPQDGRIGIKLADREIDIRVGILPTQFGERATLRLLDKKQGLITLDELGLDEEGIKKLRKLISKPYGIILVTGPTGSGKTTTLYAILQELRTPEVNIITIEDPVEYELEGISQIQVNEKAGLTFASGLRSILRHDPDIIMVGEIRDRETAEIAVQAALTGHLVLSTLHTNDAPSAITRLVEMGIEPYLVSSSVIGVIAQRLVRKICEKCREAYEESPEALEEMGLEKTATVYRGRGCPHCLDTGYWGRTALFEQLDFDEDLRRALVRSQDASVLRRLAIEKGMRTLKEDGIQKILRGITTLSEVMRVAGR
ncbi:MAG: type II secretion system ATPase GspE [Synergistetes bacterium]|nr:type II secretion system ATPase GspE [Synergistota bacterium]